MTEYFAHLENSKGIKHDRVEHLANVTRRASEFAGQFGAVVRLVFPRFRNTLDNTLSVCYRMC